MEYIAVSLTHLISTTLTVVSYTFIVFLKDTFTEL